MPRPTKGARMGGSAAHERLILANLATSLFEHGRITTTAARAKRLQPVADRLVTHAKKGDIAARRRVLTVIRDKGVVHTLFTEIGPRFDNREGGYTRIIKLEPRKGDNAPMAIIELVEAVNTPKVKKAPVATSAPTATPVAEEIVETPVAEEVVEESIETTDEVVAAEETADNAVAEVTEEVVADEAVAEVADATDEAPATEEKAE